jgi:nucleotide-binding universal stress UspA family protein
MKKILVPTDFSPVAENALAYAIEIASKFQSDILLYHVYRFRRKLDYDYNYPPDKQPFFKEVEARMEALASKYRPQMGANGIHLETKTEDNNVFFLFKNKIPKHDIDLIVMGSKGATGLEKVIYGSVAATAIETSKVPVLVVPPDHHLHKFEEILLATDKIHVAEATLDSLLKLAQGYGAKVTILRVKTPETADAENPHLLMEGIQTEFREIPLKNSVNESINDYILKHPIDLLCLIRRKKGFFESLFGTSVTEAQVYSSKVPLLVMPEIDE